MTAYLTVIELNTLVSQLFTSDELSKVGWGELSEPDKTVWMVRANRFVDTLSFRGSKSSDEQELKFPRVINKIDVGVPSAIKNCVAHITILMLQDNKSTRKKLQKDGVIEMTAGKISERYVDDSSFYTLNKELINGYLKKYLVNGMLR